MQRAEDAWDKQEGLVAADGQSNCGKGNNTHFGGVGCSRDEHLHMCKLQMRYLQRRVDAGRISASRVAA